MTGSTNREHFRTPLLHAPFHARIEALMEGEHWYDWAGYAAAMMIRDEELEYFAIRSQAALFDLTPMIKYRIEGPEAEAFLDRLTLRDVSKLKPGRVHYTAWCDDDGHVLDDGTLFRLAPDRFRLCCQERHLPWLADTALGFDVAIAEETDAVALVVSEESGALSICFNSQLKHDLEPEDLRAQLQHVLAFGSFPPEDPPSPASRETSRKS